MVATTPMHQHSYLELVAIRVTEILRTGYPVNDASNWSDPAAQRMVGLWIIQCPVMNHISTHGSSSLVLLLTRTCQSSPPGPCTLVAASRGWAGQPLRWIFVILTLMSPAHGMDDTWSGGPSSRRQNALIGAPWMALVAG